MLARKFVPAALLGCLLLCGCTAPWSGARIAGTHYPPETESLTAVLEAGELEALDRLPALRSADLRGSACYEQIAAWGAEHPAVELLYSVPLPDGGMVDSSVTALDLSAMSPEQQEQVLPLLDYLPALASVDFGRARAVDPALLQRFMDKRGDLDYDYLIALLGEDQPADRRSLSLPGLDGPGLRQLIGALPYLPELTELDLGSQESSPLLTWQHIGMLQRARPALRVSYDFRLYDRDFNTLDEEIVLSRTKLRDQGEALWAVMPYLTRLKSLEMESCGVDNEIMAEIRDLYPEVNVVWRVWFGENFSARTDAIKILASNAQAGGPLTPENTQNLKYFTKLKYIDVGHNPLLTDISFVRYMPELEVAILAMGHWSDASALAECPHLEFLELQTTELTDLTPLAGLKELRHLNIGYLFELRDISPIYDLELERLWIGSITPVPMEQVEEFQRRHPDCVINLEGSDPHYMWRWIGIDKKGNPIRHPRYDLLVRQFGYDRGEYSFEWIDNRGW